MATKEKNKLGGLVNYNNSGLLILGALYPFSMLFNQGD